MHCLLSLQSMPGRQSLRSQQVAPWNQSPSQHMPSVLASQRCSFTASQGPHESRVHVFDVQSSSGRQSVSEQQSPPASQMPAQQMPAPTGLHVGPQRSYPAMHSLVEQVYLMHSKPS